MSTKEQLKIQYDQRRNEVFSGKVCVICGSSEKLELDHIISSTKIHHAIWAWTQERYEAELDKCQILCHECHLDKSSIEISGHKPYEHGTNMEYRRGCRCYDCRLWKSQYRQNLKSRGGVWK